MILFHWKKTKVFHLFVFFSVVVSRRCRFSFLSHTFSFFFFFFTGNESEIILFCRAQSTSFFFFPSFFLLPCPIFSCASESQPSLRETGDLRAQGEVLFNVPVPHLLSNVGFRLSSSAVSRCSTRLLRKSPLCFVSHGMFGCVWSLWCEFEPCRLFFYVCMALCSCAAPLAWHICILVKLIPPKNLAAWISNPSLHYVQSQRTYDGYLWTFKKNCSEGFS